MVGPCVQSMTSASARMPATSYQPRTTTSLAAHPCASASTSAASAVRSAGSSVRAAKTENIVNRTVSLIARAALPCPGRLPLAPGSAVASDGDSLR